MRSRSWASGPTSARGTALAALGVLGGLLAGGCTSGSTELGTDAELTVYVSSPTSGPNAADGRDVVNGARMALADAGAEAGGIAVRLKALDSAPGSLPVRAAANARTAIHDSAAIAYLGDFEPGATRASLPITNQARMLQVSAASTAGDLVAPFLGSDDVPEAQPSGERTFARVIPSDEAQVAALVAAAAERGAASMAIVRDRTPFGAAVADAAEAAATGRIEVSRAGTLPPALSDPDRSAIDHVQAFRRLGHRLDREPQADALFYAGYPALGADELILSAADLNARFALGSDALLDAALLARTPAAALTDLAVSGPGAPDLLVSSSALHPAQLPPAGRDFAARFRAEHGRRPGRYAAYGYEAMAAIVDAIDRAADPADRDAVVDAFFAISERESIIGTHSIDDLGETTLDRVGSYRLSGTRLAPARPLEVP